MKITLRQCCLFLNLAKGQHPVTEEPAPSHKSHHQDMFSFEHYGGASRPGAGPDLSGWSWSHSGCTVGLRGCGQSTCGPGWTGQGQDALACAKHWRRLTERWNQPLALQPRLLFREETCNRGISCALPVPAGESQDVKHQDAWSQRPLLPDFSQSGPGQTICHANPIL